MRLYLVVIAVAGLAMGLQALETLAEARHAVGQIRTVQYGMMCDHESCHIDRRRTE